MYFRSCEVPGTSCFVALLSNPFKPFKVLLQLLDVLGNSEVFVHDCVLDIEHIHTLAPAFVKLHGVASAVIC